MACLLAIDIGPILRVSLALLFCIPQGEPWIIPQPRSNVWALLTKSLGQDHICLSTSTPDNPMSTCLVGIPLNSSEYPSALLSLRDSTNWLTHWIVARSFALRTVKVPVKNPFVLWRDWAKDLPKLSDEPAEFEILRSSSAPFCVQFKFNPTTRKESYANITQHKVQYQAAQWCKNITHVKMPSTLDNTP